MRWERPSPWTPPVVARFSELLDVRPKLYYGEIAEVLCNEFGLRLTRNACIGFGQRNGVRRKMPPRRLPPGSRLVRPRPRVAKRHLAKPRTAQPRRRAPGLIRFEQLQPRDCRWPFGDKVPYLFCGEPIVEGCPYCPQHARISYPALQRRAWKDPLTTGGTNA